MSKTRVRTILMIAVGIFLLVGGLGISSAIAETRKTVKKAKIYKRVGESSGVVAEVPGQQNVRVVKKDGRWYKVVYRGVTGWMTRTSLESNAKDRVARTERRRAFVTNRSRKRGWTTSAPDDRVGGDAIVEDDAEEEAFDEEDEADDEEDEEDEEFEEFEEEELVEEGAVVETAVRSRRKRKDRDEDEFIEDEDEDEGDDDDDDDDDDDRRRKKAKSDKRAVLVKVREADIKTKRRSRSETVLTVEEGTELIVLRKSKSGKWLFVKDRSGDEGWIKAKYVSSLGYEYPKKLIRAGARLGYTYLSQSFTTDNPDPNNPLSQYDLKAPAVALMISGEYLYRYKPKYMIGVQFAYTGGVLSNVPAQNNVEVPISSHGVDVNFLGGYNFENEMGMVAYASLGLHYGLFRTPVPPDQAQLMMVNPIQIPSENLLGPTVGVRLDVPYYNDKLGFAAELRGMLFAGNRTQTPGLTDGVPQEVKAYWLGGHVVYRYKPSFDIEGGLRITRASTNWTGAPVGRGTGAIASSSRTDTSYILTVGIGRNF